MSYLAKNKFFWIIIVLILIGYSLFHHRSRTMLKNVPVSVTYSILGNITPHFDSVGTADPQNSAVIKPQVNGQLINIAVNPGQEVTANQLLFTIDPKPFQAAVDQAKANLLRDQALAQVAHDQLIRYQKLLKPGYISKDFYDQVRGTEHSTQATVEADQAALKTAEIQLSYTEVHAPFAGRLSDINPKVGDIIKTTDVNSLTTINQFQPMDVDFSLPAGDLASILAAKTTKQPIEVVVTSTDDSSLKESGNLSFIDNAVNTTTGSVAMKSTYANRDEKIWPGEFLKVHVQTAAIPNAVLIPTIAIQQNQKQQNYVYVIDTKNIAHLRLVTLGLSDNQITNVVSGLKAEEKVVTRGQFQLTDGSTVKVMS